jgi:hypothetical protein
MWVFKYKFDEDDFLIKYKIRLCARNNLQRINQDIYVITLVARIFRTLMILIAAFDLKTQQFDAVNAFANNSINESIYCRTLENWSKSSSNDQNDQSNDDVLLLLLRALYDLKQSSAL